MSIPFLVYFIFWTAIAFSIAVPLITFYMMYLDLRDHLRQKKERKAQK